MPGWWSANDFRRARMALVAASVASWSAHMAMPMLCLGNGPCESTPVPGEEVRYAILFAGGLHLALLVSLAVERRGWLARLAGIVLLVPTSVGAALYAGMVLGSIGSPYPALMTPVNALTFALAHAAQLWRLSGFPLPPLRPLAAPVTDDVGDWRSVRGG
jgi:hypothetical protein